MATNVSSLRVAIRGDVSGLQAELEKGTASVKKFSGSFQRSQMTAAKATNAFGLSSQQASMAVTQLGFAAEDALVVYGNQGLSGALRAAGNNLSFVAAMMSPVAGIAVGVGTALAAIFIPKMLGAADATAQLTNALRELDRSDFTRKLVAAGQAAEVPGVIADNLDRFQSARKSLEAGRAGAAERARVAGGSVRDILNAEGLGFLGLDVSDKLRDSLFRGEDTAIGTFKSFFKANDIEFTKDLADRVRELSREAQLADTEVQALTRALNQLGKNEAEARQREAFGEELTKRLKPALQVGGRFGEVVNEIGAGFMADFGGQTRGGQSRFSPGTLQAGNQFGSREAVSALNRVLHTRVDPKVDEKIEKHTSKTADGIFRLITEVKNLGTAGVQALAGDAL